MPCEGEAKVVLLAVTYGLTEYIPKRNFQVSEVPCYVVMLSVSKPATASNVYQSC